MHISFVIPYYNNHDFLPACLTSIKEHTSVPHEILIIDDGSEDRAFLEGLIEPNIRVMYLDGNNGPSVGRNIGIREATGTYVFFIDSDDTLSADPAAIIEEAPDADIIVGQETGAPLGKHWKAKAPLTGNLSSEPTMVVFHHFFAMLYRRRFLLESNVFFEEQMRSGGDRVFLALALAQAKKINVQDYPLYTYRRHPNSITFDQKRAYTARRLELLEKVAQHLSPYPEAKTIRCLGGLNNNINMIRRINDQQGTDTALMFTEELAGWVKRHLNNAALVEHCVQNHRVLWSPLAKQILEKIRAGATVEQVMNLALSRSGPGKSDG